MTTVLYNAMKMNQSSSLEGGPSEDTSELPTFDISSKLTELKQTRQLGSQITMKGAALYDLLNKEVEMREKRNNVLARQLEITEVEQALRSALKGVDEEIKVESCKTLDTYPKDDAGEIDSKKVFFKDKYASLKSTVFKNISKVALLQLYEREIVWILYIKRGEF